MERGFPCSGRGMDIVAGAWRNHPMSDKPSKLDQIRSLREAREASKSSRGSPTRPCQPGESRETVPYTSAGGASLHPSPRDASSSGGVEGHAVGVSPRENPVSSGNGKNAIFRSASVPLTAAIHPEAGRKKARAGVESGPLETTDTPPKRGRPRIGEKREPYQPWVALGMSQRTWYRRKAEKAKEAEK